MKKQVNSYFSSVSKVFMVVYHYIKIGYILEISFEAEK